MSFPSLIGSGSDVSVDPCASRSGAGRVTRSATCGRARSAGARPRDKQTCRLRRPVGQAGGAVRAGAAAVESRTTSSVLSSVRALGFVPSRRASSARDSGAALLADLLAHRGQGRAEGGREVGVVVADHRQVLRDVQAQVLGGSDGLGGEDVGEAEQRGRAVGPVEQRQGSVVGGCDRARGGVAERPEPPQPGPAPGASRATAGRPAGCGLRGRSSRSGCRCCGVPGPAGAVPQPGSPRHRRR